MAWLIIVLMLCGAISSSRDGAIPAPAPTVATTPDLEAERDDLLRNWFDELTSGLDERPIRVTLEESTTGTLELGWNEHVFPILASDAGVFAAASTLGEGRLVAFSGQDFLSSDDESTLIGTEGNDTLVRNAVRWASGLEKGRVLRVLVDNRIVAEMLRDGGWNEVRIASILERTDPWETRDWSAEALSEIDVAVVQVNEWDVGHVRPSEIAALRSFVKGGGGLVIAASAMHWTWYLEEVHDDFSGNPLVAGSGIRWNEDEEYDLASARVAFGPLSSPIALWQAYLAGETLEASALARLVGLFVSAERLGRDEEVSQALKRLLAETPELPVTADDPEARLSADVTATIGPCAWPAAHPWATTFPGLPDPKAERIDRIVEVDASWTGARPLGLYAAPFRESLDL